MRPENNALKMQLLQRRLSETQAQVEILIERVNLNTKKVQFSPYGPIILETGKQ